MKSTFPFVPGFAASFLPLHAHKFCPLHAQAGFVRRVDHLRSRGLVAKLHLALDGLPDFPGLDQVGLGGRLLIAPSLDYIERAYNPSKYDEISEAPALEISPRLRETGSYERRGQPNRVADRSAARRVLACRPSACSIR